jgi:hypothetical protein
VRPRLVLRPIGLGRELCEVQGVTMRPLIPFAATLLAACSPTPVSDIDANPGGSSIDASPGGSIDAPPTTGADADQRACTSPAQPGCDCDPTGQLAAYEILVDDLGSDRGQVLPATGFEGGVWSFSDSAYRQQAEMSPGRTDASLVALAEPAGDLLIHVTASSTAATTFEGQDNLRQLFLTARTQASASEYAAAACGIDLEIDSSGAVTGRHAIAAELSGSPSSVTTQVRGSRESRQLSFGDEFDIRMELRGGQMVCQVTIDGEPFFVQASGFGGSSGSVGFHTRETQALFKNLRVCGL